MMQATCTHARRTLVIVLALAACASALAATPSPAPAAKVDPAKCRRTKGLTTYRVLETEPLADAASGLDVRRLKCLVQKAGLDVNTPTGSGKTPFLYALDTLNALAPTPGYNATLEKYVISNILKLGASPNSAWPAYLAGGITGYTPMHMAARRGDVSLMKRLITAGGNVNARDGNGHTPLYYAALCDARAGNNDDYATKMIKYLYVTNKAQIVDGDLEAVPTYENKGKEMSWCPKTSKIIKAYLTGTAPAPKAKTSPAPKAKTTAKAPAKAPAKSPAPATSSGRRLLKH